MRLLLALTVALLLAPTLVTAESQQEPRDALSVSVVRADESGVYVAWNPAPGAVMYYVYRGASIESLELISQTPATVYTDLAAPDHDLWYQIVSVSPSSGIGDEIGPMRGRCLSMRSAGIALTLAHCMPAQGPVQPLIPPL